ncbi:MAG TPA: hypothetical protein VFE39_17080 [Pseudonocardia sp.]|nr:hypothetical protein [Pseudonocardia sp.]
MFSPSARANDVEVAGSAGPADPARRERRRVPGGPRPGRQPALHAPTVDGAEHSLRTTTDGFDKCNTFAQGYVDLVGSWVTDVAAGRPAPTTVAGAGVQDRPTSAVPPLAWYESVWVHAGALAVLLVGFGGFGLDAAWRRLRGRAARRAPWPARVLAVSAGTTGDRARAGLLIAAGAVFVPWAVYLGLLLP